MKMQLGGSFAADGAGQEREDPAAAHLPVVEVRVADPGRAGDEREVAAEEELEAARRGDAVDERDHGDGQAPEPPERVVEVGDEPGERDRVALEGHVAGEVTAGAERPAGASDEHAADRGVGGDVVEGRVERVEQLVVDGVELLGPVQAQHRGAPGAVVVQGDGLEEHQGGAHVRASVVSWRTISCFCTLPDAVVGSASRTMSRSGSL